MNKYDSERIAAGLENKGYKPASKVNEADLVVVNMCSVRQSAVDRVFGLPQKLKKLQTKNHKLKTILTGCILKKDRKKFFGNFDYILNVKNLSSWPKILSKTLWTRGLVHSSIAKSYLKIKPKHSNKFSALVPIMTGCDNFCSYCVVPYTRGKEISRPAQEIICEVKNLAKKGVKEIWLLGQNVNRYCSKSKIIPQNAGQKSKLIDFPKLLRIIDKIPGKFWLRFTSPHPADFSEELIEAMAKCRKITPYLNLPVQTGDDRILRKMNRSYTIAQYKNLVKKIRKKIPDICLSTDVIVGFPGETKKQFKNTVKLFKEIKYDMAYISRYSPRAGTAAARMKDDVSSAEKKRREKVLTEVLKKTALENNKKYFAKTLKVLPTEYKKGFLSGKSFHYKTVKFRGSKNLIGKFAKVKITDAFPWSLQGKLK